MASPTKIPSGGLSEWLQGHFVAQAFQPSYQGSANSLHVDPVKVIRAEFPVVSYENTFRRSERVAPRSLCGPGVPAVLPRIGEFASRRSDQSDPRRVPGSLPYASACDKQSPAA